MEAALKALPPQYLASSVNLRMFGDNGPAYQEVRDYASGVVGAVGVCIQIYQEANQSMAGQVNAATVDRVIEQAKLHNAIAFEASLGGGVLQSSLNKAANKGVDSLADRGPTKALQDKASSIGNEKRTTVSRSASKAPFKQGFTTQTGTVTARPGSVESTTTETNTAAPKGQTQKVVTETVQNTQTQGGKTTDTVQVSTNTQKQVTTSDGYRVQTTESRVATNTATTEGGKTVETQTEPITSRTMRVTDPRTGEFQDYPMQGAKP